jgi:hypothetical protein
MDEVLDLSDLIKSPIHIPVSVVESSGTAATKTALGPTHPFIITGKGDTFFVSEES